MEERRYSFELESDRIRSKTADFFVLAEKLDTRPLRLPSAILVGISSATTRPVSVTASKSQCLPMSLPFELRVNAKLLKALRASQTNGGIQFVVPTRAVQF